MIPARSRRERAAAAFAPAAMPLAYTAVTLAFFWYLWIPFDDLQRTWRFDTVHQYWGDLIFQARTLADGQLALWNPHDRGGFPLYGDPQPGMLYPPNWLLVAAGWIAGGVDYALMEAKVVGHWIFGAAGMHLFARRRGCAEPACYVGGILFSFTGPALRYGGSALNWTHSWIPWVLLATDWFCQEPGARRAVVLGATVAMVLLSGAPAVFLYMLLLAVPYGMFALWGRVRAAIPWIAAAAGVSLLWVLPLVVGSLEMLPHTVRESRNFDFIARSTFDPRHLVNVLVPRLDGESIFYGGLPLGAIAMSMATDGARRIRVFCLCAAGGALLALGDAIDALPAAASLAPPFTLFRSAHRYLYVTSAAAAAAAALALGALLALDDPDARARLARRALRVGAGVCAVLAVGTAVALVAGARYRAESLGFGLLSASAGAALLFGLLTLEGRGQRRLAWTAVAFVAVDLAIANAFIQLPGLAGKPRTPNDEILLALPNAASSRERIYDRNFIEYRPGVRLGVRDFGGYEEDPLALTRYARFRRRCLEDPSLLGHANIRYYFADEHPWFDFSPRPSAATERLTDAIWEVSDVAPAVMYVPNPERVEELDEALARLREITPGEGAVVEGEVAGGPADAPVTAGRITAREPNRLVAEIETPAAGAVIISEAYFPAWEATVNGEPAELVPANVMFRAVSVPGPGAHRIEMTLAPAGFLWSLPAYALAWLLLAGAVAAGWIRARARRRARQG